jgi:replicative DNA helicase
MQRIISGHTGVALLNILNPLQAPESDYKAFILGAKDCSNLPLLIDDTGGLSITQLSGKARAMRREGIELLVVDYLQLMNGGKQAQGRNREQEISQISSGLKSIAKELHIPIIAVSQLSRAVEDSADKKPQLRHLRESGSLEQDAYAVAFVYRPEYYGIERDAEGNNLQGLAMVLVEKNRNGEIGPVLMRWNGPTVTFSDYAQAPASDFAPHRPGENEDLPF